MKTQIILLSVVVLLLTACTISTNSTEDTSSIKGEQTQANPVLYTSSDCPHCQDLEQYINENNLTDKLAIDKRQVGQNFPKHNQELGQRAQECGLPADNVGIPFLYAQGQCSMGSNEIIPFLNQKAGIGSVNESEASPPGETQ